MGILKRVVVTPAVYPHFFEFLHVDIQSTGHTLSRQLNDVMSEIECAQLHNELLGRRHCTLQSHSLFVLAKHLFLTHSVYSPADFLQCILGLCASCVVHSVSAVHVLLGKIGFCTFGSALVVSLVWLLNQLIRISRYCTICYISFHY